MKLITKTFESANIMELTVGTNTPQGGNSNHGGRTIFKLEDLSSTDWDIEIISDKYGNKKLSIEFGGDCEADLFIDILKYAAKTLKKQMKENEKRRNLN